MQAPRTDLTARSPLIRAFASALLLLAAMQLGFDLDGRPLAHGLEHWPLAGRLLALLPAVVAGIVFFPGPSVRRHLRAPVAWLSLAGVLAMAAWPGLGDSGQRAGLLLAGLGLGAAASVLRPGDPSAWREFVLRGIGAALFALGLAGLAGLLGLAPPERAVLLGPSAVAAVMMVGVLAYRRHWRHGVSIGPGRGLAAVVLGLSLLVALGWMLRAEGVARLGTVFAAMSFSAAVSAALAASAIAATLGGQRRLARTLTAAALLPSLAAMLVRAFELDIDLGAWLSWIGLLGPEGGGRISGPTPSAFVLVALGLLLAPGQERDGPLRWAPTWAAGLSLAVIAGIIAGGMLIDLPGAAEGDPAASLSLATALAMALLGLALAFADFDGERRGRWLPLIAGLAAIGLSAVLWTALARDQAATVTRVLEAEMDGAQRLVERALLVRIGALARAGRVLGSMPEERREALFALDAAALVEDFEGIDALAWLGPDGRLRHRHQPGGADTPADDGRLERAWQRVLEGGGVALGRHGHAVHDGGRGFLLVAAAPGGQGAMVAQLREEAVIAIALTGLIPEAPLRVGLEDVPGHPPLFERMAPEGRPLLAGRLEVGGLPLTLEIWMPATLAPERLPAGLLAMGLIAGVLVALALRLAVRARERADEAEAAIAALQAETLERERAQDELRAAEADLAHAATHDAVTGLPRFQVLDAELGQHAPATGLRVTMLMLDLDGFHAVNESLGHARGDDALRGVAARLLDAVGGRGRLARFGSDAFLAVYPGLGSEDAEREAERLRARLAEPLEAGGVRFFLTASVGIARGTLPRDDFTELVRRAEAAKAQAKRDGRDLVRIWDERDELAREDRLALGAALREAIRLRELRLVYQPLVGADDGRLRGFEALLRWHSPRFGDVPPLRFVPVAESFGLMPDIGHWVIVEACRQLAAWKAAGHGPLRIAVNVAAQQLSRPGLVEQVGGALLRFGVEPAQLELELTEGSLIENLERAQRVLAKLKAIGVGLSIDDFGTGYSSLAYLKQFSVDKLKIDRSFVVDLPNDTDDAAIARTIVAMGHQLRLTIVAEGVEHSGQAGFLASIGCDELQGYHIARPMEAGQVEAWMRGRPPGVSPLRPA